MRHPFLYSPPRRVSPPLASTRDCTLLAEPLLGLQLNPLCKFMTNELLFAVFTQHTKRHKICQLCDWVPLTYLFLTLFPSLSLSLSMGK